MFYFQPGLIQIIKIKTLQVYPNPSIKVHCIFTPKHLKHQMRRKHVN